MSASRRFLLAFAVSTVLFAGTAARWDRDALLVGTGSAEMSSGELSQEEKAAVLGALGDFNRIYQDFYATGGDPRLIDEMPASREVKHQIFRDLGYLRDAGRILVMDEAQSLPVSAVDAGDGTVEVTVFEEWNFVYQDATTRKPVTEVKGMGQGYRYTLRQKGEHWEIRGWEPVFMARPSQAEGFVW